MDKVWVRVPYFDNIHVIPWNDTKDHSDTACWCHPDIDKEDGQIVVMHNANDGREFLEPKPYGH